LLLPRMDHRRMHAVERRQLADRLITLHRGQRHLGLERRRVRLPFPCHDYPFLGQPIVAYSTVQFLGSTSEIIKKVNDLFEGELTEQDKLVYVNNVIMGKLLESEKLAQQAANNTKEQFANSPDLKSELMNAIIGALEAHTAMSTQALGSESVREGLKDVLLGPAGLYEALREQAGGDVAQQ
jgi:hypothetical protein